jgi:hypothetical protein
VRDVARHQRRLGSGEAAEGEQIGLVHRGSDRDDLVGDLARRSGVAGADRSDGIGDEQHAPRRDRDVGSQVLDDALGSCHPPARLRHLAAQQQDERCPARAQRGPVGSTGAQVLSMGPLPRPDAVLVPPEQVRRHREHLELVGLEVHRIGEQGVHLEPRVPSERLPRSLHAPTVDLKHGDHPPHSAAERNSTVS